MSRPYRLPRDLVVGDHVAIIDAARASAGYLGAHTSAGAVALAKWLAADPERTKAVAARANSPLQMGFNIDRILSGEVMPANGLIEALGRMTDGAVHLALFWNQVPWAGAIDEETERAAAAVADTAAPLEISALGETAAGPLVAARLVDHGRLVELNTGMGLSLRLTIAAAHAIRASLGTALDASASARGEVLAA